jgi:hypothetical protein
MEHVKEYKRQWYKKTLVPTQKWPPGAAVEVLYAGFWCRGTIIRRENNLRITVRLAGAKLSDVAAILGNDPRVLLAHYDQADEGGKRRAIGAL